MIGSSWSSYAPMRVKCIHRWRLASSCRRLCSDCSVCGAPSSLVAIPNDPPFSPTGTRRSGQRYRPLGARTRDLRSNTAHRPCTNCTIARPTFWASVTCVTTKSRISSWTVHRLGGKCRAALAIEEEVTEVETATTEASEGVRTGPALPTVRLEDVTKRFGDVTAVDQLTLDIERGEFF